MKKILSIATLGLAAMCSSAFALNDTKDVAVTVNLTPVCTISTIGALTFTYTANQTLVANGSGGGFTVQCTKGLDYKLAFDSTDTTKTTTSGTLVGLNYALGLSGTTGTGGVTPQSFNVTGTIAGNQAGQCAGPTTGGVCSATANHPVYVVY